MHEEKGSGHILSILLSGQKVWSWAWEHVTIKSTLRGLRQEEDQKSEVKRIEAGEPHAEVIC